jgi:hypothetical protein
MMKKKLFACLLMVMVILSCIMVFQFQTVTAESWFTGWSYRKSHIIDPASGAGTNYQIKVKTVYKNSFCEQGSEPLGLDTFEASDVDSNGNLLVGKSYKIYKSMDNGKTFSLIYTIPSQPDPFADYAGRVLCVFIDSRNYIFVSAGSTNRLYRSTNGGESFSEVLLLTGRTGNNGQINTIAEDQDGYLYAAEFGVGQPSRVFKSTDAGANWVSIRNFDAYHLHAVAFNPYNNWLYVITGERLGTERDRVYRSKDGGSNWQILVDTQATDVPYVAINFIDDLVYLGEDNWQGSNDIHRFQDDGVSEPFTPTTVFTNPYSYAPWMSSTKVGDYLVFASFRDVYNSVSVIVKTVNGVDWEIVKSYATKDADRILGHLTKHARKGQAFVTITTGASTYVTSTSLFDLVSLNEKCRTDFGDVRFTDDDGTTLLDYWMEEKVDGDYAIFWVEVADNLSSANATIYVYYGKSDATNLSNGANTFLFFDDFPGSSYDPDKWETVGSPTVSVSDSCVTVSRNSYSGAWSAHGLKTKTFLVDEARIIAKGKTSSTHAYPTAGHACDQFTSKGARNGVVFARSDIWVDADGRDEGAGITAATLQAYSTNTFYSLYLYRWGTSYTKGYVNGIYKGQVTSNVRDGNRNIAIWIQEWNSYSGTRDVVVDWVAIAKYVDPEPTHGSWGSEEISDAVMINQAFVSDERADVGSVQTIGFHAKWNNGSNVVGGSIYLNGTEYITNSTGWINVGVYSSKVGKEKWIVTGVNCNGVTTYIQTAQNPSIIWDQIQIVDGGITKESALLGETVTIWFKALYEYDNGVFKDTNGVLAVNGSAMSWSIANNRWEHNYSATTIGTKAFRISGVSDHSYNLTVINDTIGAQSVSVWSLPFSVISNSTISELVFNSTSKILSFTVSEPSGTTGYTNVTIAKTLIEDISQLKVYLDGKPINYTVSSTDYSWLIHFTYNHSTHKVVIILGSQHTESLIETPFEIAIISIGIVITILAAILFAIKKHSNSVRHNNMLQVGQ